MYPLDPASAAGRPDRKVNQGHGTRALGPSDSSDSGSDVAGEPMAAENRDIDTDHVEILPDNEQVLPDDEDEEGEPAG
jgi:hypothetical protein